MGMILFLRHRKSGKKRKLNAEEEKRKKDRGRRKRNAREKQPRLPAEVVEVPLAAEVAVPDKRTESKVRKIEVQKEGVVRDAKD